ncbi:MAG TPA: hypothetical protein VEF35_06715 [Candidatus Bathyarchaeia archaeon]|nr:hypothetical protein [Candidatus Bathyarchaeia archaeon]
MKRQDRATISVSKKTHPNFEEYRAKLRAERKKVQTEEDVVRALLEMGQKGSWNVCHISCLPMDGSEPIL